jgi:glyoxylase-like metal-dependent hydrolase (beta-lactamase superfamily II)
MNFSAPLTAETRVPLGDDLERIVAGNAGLMTGPGTNSYVVGARELTVLDPGPDLLPHIEALLSVGAPRIRYILTTHTHKDHSPAVAPLAARTGATIIGLPPPRDGRQDESFVPQQQPRDGQVLHLGDEQFIAIHTPGHASNCVCYLWTRGNVLFTGDHILEGVSPVILPPDGDMSQYFGSLDKLLAYPFEYIAPGHGRLMGEGKRVVGALRGHRQAREEKVLHCLALLKQATLASLTVTVYDDVPVERHGWARLTLEAHLIKLERDGKASREGEVWRPQPA